MCILAGEKSIDCPGLSEDVILIQIGAEVTHEPQHVGFNEQWLNSAA